MVVGVLGAGADRAHRSVAPRGHSSPNDEVHGRHPLLPAVAEIGRTGRCVRIDVRPFDQSTTVSMVRTMDGVPDRLDAVDVHRRSGGNAFFVEELVAASAAGLAGLPDTFRDVILGRTASLDDSLLELLAVAGVAGSTLPAVLADGCGRSEDVVRALLRELYPLGLLSPDGDEVRFRHELRVARSSRPSCHRQNVRSSTPAWQGASPVTARGGWGRLLGTGRPPAIRRRRWHRRWRPVGPHCRSVPPPAALKCPLRSSARAVGLRRRRGRIVLDGVPQPERSIEVDLSVRRRHRSAMRPDRPPPTMPTPGAGGREPAISPPTGR